MSTLVVTKIKLHTKFEMSDSTRSKDMMGTKISQEASLPQSETRYLSKFVLCFTRYVS